MRFVYIIITFTTLLSCSKEKRSSDRERVYLFLAHTRTDNNPEIDHDVKNIEFDRYNLLVLGGDLSYLTSNDEQSIIEVGNIFNLKSPSTLFAPGNHDYSNPELLKKHTNRELFYSYSSESITWLILDTEKNSCNIKDDQMSLVKSVCDTISKSTHLILVSHKLLWLNDNGDLQKLANDVPNAGIGNMAHQINPNNFYSEIYPLLTKVQNRGTQVICLAGDIGFKKNQFEYLTNEGIWLLASGIKFNDDLKFGLRFIHNLTKMKLSWEYTPVQDL